MTTDVTRKYYGSGVIILILLIFAITIASAEDGNGSGEGDGSEFEDEVQKIDPAAASLKLMSRQRVQVLNERKRKTELNLQEQRLQEKLLGEDVSSGFGELVEEEVIENPAVTTGNVKAVNAEDDDEDNERNENPPVFPRTDFDPSWNQKQQKVKGKPNDNTGAGANGNDEEKTSDPRPNIILILTDDQDIELGSMEYMPETLKVFREGGVEFRHGYVTTPMCCPSRSSMLTGLYVHNHQVYTNNDNCSSVFWRERFEKKTFASYLWAEGYYTAYIGKYLNKYDGSHIPHGWDEWNALLMNSRFYNYTVNRNGKKIRYGNKYEKDYYPDSIANDTIDFLNRMAEATESDSETTDAPTPGANGKIPSQPFLLVVSFPSPHGPEDSAPQYSQMFLNDTPHHTPSYNYAPNTDKQWILRTTARMTPILKDFTNMLMTKRLQTLQSVDLAVKNIFDNLKRSQLIDNTYIFYTSDHGYHVGQFGLVKGKSMPFEFDIRVPFFLRTPKNLVPGRTLITEPVLNIDLAPTFLDLAGVVVPEDMDGRSMVPILRKYATAAAFDDGPGDLPLSPMGRVGTEMFLIESSGRRDIGPDGSSLSPTKKSKNKSGEITENETIEMTNLCLAHPHPCQPGQKKYCKREKTRIRFRKCRTGNDGDEIMSADGTGQGSEVTNTNSTCKCTNSRRRRKRSPEDVNDDADEDDADEDEDEEFDWDIERDKIDAEIEALKLRIESLRERRRDMRRRWTSKAYTEKLQKSPRINSTIISQAPVVSKKKNQIQVTVIQPPIGGDIRRVGAPTPSTSTSTSRPPRIDDIVRMQTPQEILSMKGRSRNGDEGKKHRKDPDDDDDDDQGEEEIPLPPKIPKPRTRAQPPPVEENKTVKPINNNNENEEEARFQDMIEEEERKINRGNNGKGRKGKGRGNKGQDQSQATRILKNNGNGNGMRNEVRERDEMENQQENANGDCDCEKLSTQREREERKRKKLMSKLRKKQRYLNRIDDPRERHEAETCGTEDRMNCFWHDKDHWRTAPFWTSDSFCFCMNSNNNTYSCLRAINSTHNYLYCQFITGFRMFFDLRQDPYELKNLIGNLRSHEESWISAQLMRLKSCKGRSECGSQNYRSVGSSVVREDSLPASIWEKIFGRLKRKKKNRNGNGNHRRQQNG